MDQKEKLVALHKQLGIDRAVIVQASCHGPDNRAMMDAIASNPDKYRGVCIANDSFTDEEFADLDAGGVRGIRFNFVTHLGGTPDLDMMRRVLARKATWLAPCHSCECRRYHQISGLLPRI